jgi:D-xylose transport system substrate-binding protein
MNGRYGITHGIRKRAGQAVLTAVLCLALLSGCGKAAAVSDAGTAGSSDPAKQPVIGIVFDSFVIERWERDRDVFSATAKELGAEVNVQDANGDPEKQIAIINHFIDSKVDVIVIVATDGKKLTDCVTRAHRAGIKVISYDRLVNNADTDLYISFDNEAVGKYMAEVINDALPDGGSYVKVNGPSTDYNVTLVNQGFDETIHDNIHLFDETECAAWNDEEAFQFLTARPNDLTKADAIMCGNDSLAGQTVRALAERQRAGKVIVTGQDADLEACQRIVEGTQTMTVYKPIDELASQAAEYAVRLAKGGIAADETISDGTYDIPYVRIAPVKVTKDNLDQVIIAGGFHLKEDVYLHSTD